MTVILPLSWQGYTASRGSVGSINMTVDGNSQRKQTRTLELKGTVSSQKNFQYKNLFQVIST
jgi:hypothetical protein